MAAPIVSEILYSEIVIRICNNSESGESIGYVVVTCCRLDLPVIPRNGRGELQLYRPNASPILVKCNWNEVLPMDGTIPLSIAMPLILERELPCWRWSDVAETWETMRPCFLGTPYGSRSSLFLNRETGQAIKKIWDALISTGMFGTIVTHR
jgi:hypothetical protein